MEKIKIYELLRWIGFLPGAIVISILTHCICHFSHYFFTGNTSIALDIFSSAVSASSLVMSGAYIAPRGQKVVAIVLSTILCIAIILGYIITLLKDGFEFFYFLIVLAGLLGSIVSANIVYNNEKEFQL